MDEQKPKQNQKELLYSPHNWGLYAFFLTPILPAIFYYRNAKLLGESEKGRNVLLGSIGFIVAFFVLVLFLPEIFSSLIFIVETIAAVILAIKFGNTQRPAYEKMKKEKGLQRGRKEASMVILFIFIMIGLSIVLPTLLLSYIEANSVTSF